MLKAAGLVDIPRQVAVAVEEGVVPRRKVPGLGCSTSARHEGIGKFASEQKGNSCTYFVAQPTVQV